MNIITKTNLPGLTLLARGKVRELYDFGDHLLMVATDRLSAFDVVFSQGIPNKGKALTQLSIFWFQLLEEMGFKHHFITADTKNILKLAKEQGADLSDCVNQFEGRCMVVQKLKILPVECIVRGYIVGSGWKDYQKTGAVCGIKLPDDLELCEQLPTPIFTPSTKAEHGNHDENISFNQMIEIVGEEIALKMKELSIAVYNAAANYASKYGILIADTKFEIGLDQENNLVLADEVLTPDSSRFWSVDNYQIGRNQSSFDKQIVRDYIETTDWNKEPPAPKLPTEIITKTTEKYNEVVNLLTTNLV